MSRFVTFLLIGSFLSLYAPVTAKAEVTLPAIIGNNMVLQRDAKLPIWGWADPGETVRVRVPERGQDHTTQAGADGTWRVQLDPLKLGDPISLVIEGGNKLTLRNVLAGEVWVCSGQSNMQWSVASASDPDLEIRAAKYPRIRLIQVRTEGTQEPLGTFDGEWKECSPETVGAFSAVGYFFGRQLHQTLDVPIGLIDNAWGGSACEAWIRRDLLEDESLYGPLLARWAAIEAEFNWDQELADYEKSMAAWKVRRDAARKEGKPIPRAPRRPRNQLTGQHRPGNLFNGRLMPVVPFAIRGAVWYQGETNASRAYQYREMFPLMIQNWRDVWGQGDFPFYYVQLADFRAEKKNPAESDWAELREAQTQTMDRLKNVGEAVIIDLGEGRDIHPKNKQDVAKRLARWALARDYGIEIPYQSPRVKDVTFAKGKVTITFDHVAGGLRAFDTVEVVGFTVADDQREFVAAPGRIVGKNQVEISCPEFKKPVAVRYAWADNPVCNLFSSAGLPATPFRSDDWKGVTADNR